MRDLFALIATHGRTPLLERTLASLAACPRPPGYRGTIVVENGSREGAEELVDRADPALRASYLHAERANKSAALNLALEQCSDAFILFLDDDILVSDGILESYAAARERHPGRHFFGGPCLAEWESEPVDWLKPLLPASAKGWSLPEAEHDRELRSVMFLGANWAAEAAEVLELGGFDPRRGPGTPSMGQESDMMQRLVNRGWTGRYVAEAVVHHHVPADRCSPEWAIARATRFGTALAHGCRLTGRSTWSRAAAYAALQPLVIAKGAVATVRRDEPGRTRAACLRNRRAAFIRETLRGGGGRSTPPA